MCKVYFNKKSRRITAYKLLAQRISDGKLLSTFTGEPFELGVVPKAPEMCKRITNWNCDLDDYPLSECGFYNKEYDGYTSGFVDKADAMRLKQSMCVIVPLTEHYVAFKLVIAKISFEGNTYGGQYMCSDIIAGNNIKSIKVLNDDN